MSYAWLTADDGATLIRADRIVEICGRGGALVVRTADDPVTLHDIVATKPDDDDIAALGADLMAAVDQADELANHYHRPQRVSAVFEDGHVCWTIDQMNADPTVRLWPGGRNPNRHAADLNRNRDRTAHQ